MKDFWAMALCLLVGLMVGIGIGTMGRSMYPSPSENLTTYAMSEVDSLPKQTGNIYLKIETDYILIQIPQADVDKMSKQELRDVATFMALTIPGGRLIDGETVKLLAHKFVEKYIVFEGVVIE